jgi:carbon monoxide dehydrogenase subunit G
MEIVGEYVFDLPQDKVWEVLRDPKALAAIIPMVRDVRQIADNRYTGVLFFRVGSVAGTFHGTIELLNVQEPEGYDINVQGTSSVGQVQINGGMRLEVKGDQTIMFYQGRFQFGGRIASVGSRFLEVAVRSVINQSFETLSRYLIVKYK